MLKDRTLRSILEDPMISDIAVDAISKWDLSKEEFYDWTLEEISEKMGWSNLERGFGRLFDVASHGNYYFGLYSEEECADAPEKIGRNIVFLPSEDPEADNRPFIFLVPGGGFVNVWSLTEGWPTAEHFNERGYHVFILTYQVETDASAAKAMDDIARAMGIIRERKDEFHVDPDRYITCGFSAGGYIVCLWNTEKGYRAYDIPKPQACFPIYPVTSYRIIDAGEWDEGEDKDEFAAKGTGCTMEEACNSCFEIPLHVEGFPPTAIFLAAEDELVDPDHSRNLAAALDKAGILCRLEIGPTGGHGFADGTGMCMEGWPERAIDWYQSIIS
ncbi:MAG: alpha/beta hydrolase [Lachnospiraceae bacterium]|nr:alpha/beta hydrolase [Lachnospiraceae bacterium]